MRRNIIPYNPNLKEKARNLRNNSTLGEILLWKKLKGKQFWGYDFHRQKPLLEFIVDFYCYELKLVIEIDGTYHERQDVAIKDLERQKQIEQHNLHFLRFTEIETRTQMNSVLRVIENYIIDFEKHTPYPFGERKSI